MSLVSSLNAGTEEIPHEPGQSFTFRFLNWKQLAEAKAACTRGQIAIAKDYGAEFMGAMQSVNSAAAAATARAEREANPDLLSTYDQDTLLRYGIAGWSYGVPVTPATIADLDATTAEWAARRIAALNTPPSEADRKSDA